MNKVYFLDNPAKLETACRQFFPGVFPKDSKLVIKLHFGEPGNKTALFPKDISPIIKALEAQGIKSTMIDTPVAYDSPRNTAKGYQKAAKERGYEALGEILISDTYIKYPTKDFTAEVARELVEAENVLVISHVKGHTCAGFGGAIKNFGMGGVSPKTKGLEHGLCKPIVGDGCVVCGICAELCPAGAIKVEDKAKINTEECWGCSICQINCPQKAIEPEKSTFDDLLAQGAAAVINNLPEKVFYINIIKNITKSCDCEVDSGEIISKDVGILFSDNPVAIDAASIDLINKANEGKNLFKEINHKDPMLQVDFAAQYTGKSKEYQLEVVK